MAEADIAYAATAGAAGLALAVSAWAWRLRARLEARTLEAEAGRAALLAASGRQAALMQAFDDINLALGPDGRPDGEPIGPAEAIEHVKGCLL